MSSKHNEIEIEIPPAEVQAAKDKGRMTVGEEANERVDLEAQLVASSAGTNLNTKPGVQAVTESRLGKKEKIPGIEQEDIRQEAASGAVAGREDLTPGVKKSRKATMPTEAPEGDREAIGSGGGSATKPGVQKITGPGLGKNKTKTNNVATPSRETPLSTEEGTDVLTERRPGIKAQTGRGLVKPRKQEGREEVCARESRPGINEQTGRGLVKNSPPAQTGRGLVKPRKQEGREEVCTRESRPGINEQTGRGLAKNSPPEQGREEVCTSDSLGVKAPTGRGLRKNSTVALTVRENTVLEAEEAPPTQEATSDPIASSLHGRGDAISSSLAQEDPTTPRGLQMARSGDSRLAVALPVDEEAHASSLMEAQRVDVEEVQKRREREHQKSCAWRFGLIVFGGVAILALVAFLLAFFLSGNSTETVPPPEKIVGPALSPKDFALSLLPEPTHVALKDNESPQSKAFQWILEDPNLSNYSADRIKQRFALATLYHSTNGGNWINNDKWLSHNHHECKWFVTPMDVDEYAALVASGYDYDADFLLTTPFFLWLRDVQATYLPCLQDNNGEEIYSHLWLLGNNLEGETLPRELFLLTSLKSLIMHTNPLDGAELPANLGDLTSLEVLSVLNCGLEGSLPSEIGLLSNLKLLDLERNNLEGSIPSEIGLLSDQLSWQLDLLGNKLSGTIPSQLGLLHNAPEVWLSINALTGTIPPQLGSIKNAEHLNLYGNQLSGTIPSQLGLLNKATVVSLGANMLEGAIPSELGLLLKANHIYLIGNGLTGAIPSELSNLVINGNLESIHLNNNSLAGSVPEELCSIEVVSNYNSNLTGCNCTCTFEWAWFPQLPLCSPLPALHPFTQSWATKGCNGA